MVRLKTREKGHLAVTFFDKLSQLFDFLFFDLMEFVIVVAFSGFKGVEFQMNEMSSLDNWGKKNKKHSQKANFVSA